MNLILFLSKMILISGMLTGYYWLFLRNKKFHQYNRFFLLSIPAISICLPLLNIPIPGFYLSNQDAGIKLLQVVTISHWEEAVVITPHQNYLYSLLSAQNIAWAIFMIVALIMLIVFARNIFHIKKIASIYPHTNIEGTSFYQTDEPGTPFSFLKNIFWNNNIDISSEKGRQIFRHEIYHVKQKHTADILFMEVICILFWFNPFFHLIKKEIKTVHEFLADQFAISEYNRHDYAELLVFSALTNYQYQMGNPFFNNQIKRRIAMLTQLKNSRYGYINRVMALPLLFILVCAFAVKTNTARNLKNIHSSKPITVVIDAGHGGIFNGTRISDDVQEKNINLSIAKKIELLSKDYNINIVMTREKDVAVGNANTLREDLQNRINIASENKADAFISIHLDVNVKPIPEKSGFGIYVPRDNSDNYSKSKVLASAITAELKNVYTTDDQLKTREKGVLVLDKNTVPAIMIECGYINNKTDLAFISDPANQEKIARNILEGIVRYNENNNALSKMNDDTIPKLNGSIISVDAKNQESFLNTIVPNEIENIEITSRAVLMHKKDKTTLQINRSFETESSSTINVNGSDLNKIRFEYGSFFFIKKDNSSLIVTINKDNKEPSQEYQKTFTKVEVEAEYPRGQKAWAEYLTKNLKYPENAIKKNIQGTVITQFIVEIDGSISNIKIIKRPDPSLSEVSYKAIQNSGKWIPAMQNGKKVRAYKRQPIVFKLDDK